MSNVVEVQKIANYIRKSPTLNKILGPISRKYVELSGYRKLGLRYDDLLMEESPKMQTALGRLSAREGYDRAFRIRRAHQAELAHILLPKDQWIKPDDDIRYLAPKVAQVEQEIAEEQELDNIVIIKK